MIDSLGDVGAALADARPESLSRLYQHLGLELRYEPHDRAVVATASPRVVEKGSLRLRPTLSLQAEARVSADGLPYKR